MTIPVVDVQLMPLLGEPLPLEFANTAYLRPGSPIDFLVHAEGIVHWFTQVAVDSPAAMPRRLDDERCESVRELRDAVRSVFESTTSESALAPTALATLTRVLASSPCRVHLDWSHSQPPAIRTVPIGRGFDAALAYLSIECALFIASPALGLVRRCNGPDCPMFFVQTHHKRRFCHDGCAHRARQNRYYRNHHTRRR